jgi:hypothetical protein
MRPRFQADADFNHKVVRGIRRREPAVDFQSAQHGGEVGIPDPEVLARTADAGRILVSHDRRTMLTHFVRFLETRSSPGLILVPQDLDIGTVIDDLLLIWATSDRDEWRDRAGYLPL